MNRYMSNDKIVRAIRTANDYGLHTSVFLMIGLPHETRDDVMATIKLMAKARPGRYRWSYFFPYPGTKAYQLIVDADYIDAARMAQMENFTDGSCLKFSREHDLFLRKVGRAMPWFVNAYSDLAVADLYQEKIADILAMDETAWEKKAADIIAEDQEISKRLVQQGLSHYAIKYNAFMGVISDYFISE
jgi:tRNA A37 methylthiotransferase MiaB